jgi:hypothetical protein
MLCRKLGAAGAGSCGAAASASLDTDVVRLAGAFVPSVAVGAVAGGSAATAGATPAPSITTTALPIHRCRPLRPVPARIV